jgi:hypothetical protein
MFLFAGLSEKIGREAEGRTLYPREA